MNPLWNTLIVAGIEEVDEVKQPFIGVITQVGSCEAFSGFELELTLVGSVFIQIAFQKGVAYTVKHVATGLGAMLLNQAVEDEFRKKVGYRSERLGETETYRYQSLI